LNNYAPANYSFASDLISHASFCAFKKKSFVDVKGVKQRRRMMRIGLYFLGNGLEEV
jgi:hypothetical protein